MTYGTLIKGLLMAGNTKFAEELFDRMFMVRAVPNVNAYCIMVHYFCKTGQIGLACSYFNNMIKWGISPDIISYSALVNGLPRAHRVDEAMTLYEEIVEMAKRLGFDADLGKQEKNFVELSLSLLPFLYSTALTLSISCECRTRFYSRIVRVDPLHSHFSKLGRPSSVRSAHLRDSLRDFVLQLPVQQLSIALNDKYFKLPSIKKIEGVKWIYNGDIEADESLYQDLLNAYKEISIQELAVVVDSITCRPTKLVLYLCRHARIQNQLMKLFQVLVSDFVHVPLILHGYNSYVVVALLQNRQVEPILELESSSF